MENEIDIYSLLNKDEPKQYTAEEILKKYLNINNAIFLDLGCGKGGMLKKIKRDYSELNITYYGVDIEKSPEVDSRTIESNKFLTYDGINIPFEDFYFDFVFSNLVLEHVRYPDFLIKDVFRVIKRGGLFIGAVAYLAPYHSQSIFNFTPYGLVKICSEHGFKCKELKPGIDGIAMITRAIVGNANFPSSFWSLSPQNNYIMSLNSVSNKRKQNMMLHISGVINFVFEKQ